MNDLVLTYPGSWKGWENDSLPRTPGRREHLIDLEREHATWIPTFLIHANLSK